MKKENRQKFIYVHATGEMVPVSDEVYYEYYRPIRAHLQREQYHHRCNCPKQFMYQCDGDCYACRYHVSDEYVSMDAPDEESRESIYESIPDEGPEVEKIVSDRLLIARLFERLRELDPDADKIIAMWKEDPDISDREIARRLGIPHKTFVNRMNKYRAELKKIKNF